jgi:hypothetical protein
MIENDNLETAGYGTPQNNLHPEGGPRHPMRSYKKYMNNRTLFCDVWICIFLLHNLGTNIFVF